MKKVWRKGVVPFMGELEVEVIVTVSNETQPPWLFTK